MRGSWTNPGLVEFNGGGLRLPPFPFDTDASSSEGEDCLDEALVSKTPCLGGIFFKKCGTVLVR